MPQDLVVCAERVQLGPAVEVLEGVVRPVVRAPAQECLEIAAVVVILLEELAAGGNAGGEDLPFEARPRRCRHGRVDGDGGRSGRGDNAGCADQQDDQRALRHARQYGVNPWAGSAVRGFAVRRNRSRRLGERGVNQLVAASSTQPPRATPYEPATRTPRTATLRVKLVSDDPREKRSLRRPAVLQSQRAGAAAVHAPCRG